MALRPQKGKTERTMTYTFADGEQIEGSREALTRRVRALQQEIDNYLDIGEALDSDAFVARGNGFCDAKYSEDFVESQTAKLREKLAECKKFLSLHP